MVCRRLVFINWKNSLHNNTLLNALPARRFHVISVLRNEHSSCCKKFLLNDNFSTCYSPVHIFESKITSINAVQRYLSTSKSMMVKSEVSLSKKEQLKKAIKEYGSTVIVFHVTLSLASLGICYLVVSSGIDMHYVMTYFGENYKFVESAGTFVTAYAIHKLFAPLRISITLCATPFIVRYMRNIGILRRTP